MLVDPPRAEARGPVDGFTSYLARLITTAVPHARWLVGEQRIEDDAMRNYLVLAAGGHQIFRPGIPLCSAYRSAHCRVPMSGTGMLRHVQHTITALHGEGPVAGMTEEPLVTVVAELECFDVELRTDLTEDHSEMVEQMVTELTDRDGVASIYRSGPEALVFDVPDWDETRLKLWLTL